MVSHGATKVDMDTRLTQYIEDSITDRDARLNFMTYLFNYKDDFIHESNILLSTYL